MTTPESPDVTPEPSLTPEPCLTTLTLTAELCETDAAVTLSAAGEMDLFTRHAVAERTAEAVARAAGAGKPLVLDLTGVEFIDSSGLALASALLMSCRAAGVSLSARLRAGSQPSRVWDRTMFGRVIPAVEERLTAEDDRPKGERDHEDIRDTTAER